MRAVEKIPHSPSVASPGSTSPTGNRRGIAPALLVSQVRNTAPFLWEREFQERLSRERHPHVFHLLDLDTERDTRILESPFEFFKLCLSAHYASVATFVPTDVDNAIRFKLWEPTAPVDQLVAMAELVLASLHWDFLPLTTRFARAPGGETLSGHEGEWYSMAAAAYGCLRKREPDTAARVAGEIVREYRRQEQIFNDLRKARDGIGALKAATLIAHNLGDLDRVLEQWGVAGEKIPLTDPLAEIVYDGGNRGLKALGALNTRHMAAENHRHFALRGARALRRSVDFLLPTGPFFDDWGARLARHPAMPPEELAEVVQALVDGWEKLKEPTVGYARALSGILEAFPGGFSKLSRHLPARVERALQAGKLRTLISVPRSRFESQWAQWGLT